mmetsp:Transcript_772/g.2559  ORF Transcript_772/g.2559 Transcript_772/m.2559 type:complete len:352 (+) Transcript_772:854-1909(+)
MAVQSAQVGSPATVARGRRAGPVGRAVSHISAHDVDVAISKNKEKKAARMGRSRSEINLDDVKAAFNEQRKAARPHPFLNKDAKRKGGASTPTKHGPPSGITSPTTGSPRVGQSPSTPRRSRDASAAAMGRRTPADDRKDPGVNPYPKRMHPKLVSPATGSRAKKPGRGERSSPSSRRQAKAKGGGAAVTSSADDPPTPRMTVMSPLAPQATAVDQVDAAAEWEGAYDEDEEDDDDEVDMPEHRESPVSAARELTSELLSRQASGADASSGGTTDGSDTVYAARAAAAFHLSEGSPENKLSESARAAKVARSKRLAKQRAMASQDPTDAAALVAKARASREAASLLMASSE